MRLAPETLGRCTRCLDCMSGLLLTRIHSEVLLGQGVKGIQQLGRATVVPCPQP